MKRTVAFAALLLLAFGAGPGQANGPGQQAGPGPRAPAAQDGPTIVIVHGAWGGGWDWKPVEAMLRAQGRVVYRPTLTGLGERHHLASRDVGLETHVADVANVLVWERLDDAVLVGHSYGGMVITGVAERVPDRIRRLVYLDAFLPFDGECLRSVGNDDDAACGEVDASAPGVVDGLVVPRWVDPDDPFPRDVPHPAKTFVDRVELEGEPGHGVPATYVLTVSAPGEADDFRGMAERARGLGWPVLELVADHNAQRSNRDGLVELLLGMR